MTNLTACKTACAVVTLWFAGASVLSAKTFKTLYSFSGLDGANPYATVTMGTDGDFYGTTYDGGSVLGGTVFKMTPKGKLTTIYEFCHPQGVCYDGKYPDTVLVEGADGSFYGTTQWGGEQGGYGTIFKVSRKGKLTTLHSFGGTDGTFPFGSMVLASDGNFYGTTQMGGASNDGTVFRMTPRGNLTILYSFCSQANCADGQYPYGPIIQGSDGKFYGTTQGGGGIAGCSCGTVFKITARGKLTTLHVFDGADGENPWGGVVESADGDFYGTTAGGGGWGVGTVFRMSAHGELTTLYAFKGSDGQAPYALMLSRDGRFYGTTSTDGANGGGTVFRISARGKLETLHDFGGADGGLIYSGLIQDTDGSLYGTTFLGGSDDDGTIFRFPPTP